VYTYDGCTGPTVGSDISLAASNNCCSLLFTWDNTDTLTKNNVGSNLYCDGIYQVKITAHHPSFTEYTDTYTANINVKYDCQGLTNDGMYAVPTESALR